MENTDFIKLAKKKKKASVKAQGLCSDRKNKALKAIAISNIITMIVTIITFIIIKSLLNFIDQRLTGGWLSNIYLRGMFILIMFEFIINLILVISTIKLKRNN